MKQNESNLVSVLLYVMVGISLFLTWRILIVPSNNSRLQTINQPAQTSNIASVKNIEDIFSPHQMVVHTSANTYITQNPNVLDEANEFLASWKMVDFEFQSTYSEEMFRELLLELGKVEMKFPASIRLGLISRYFENLSEDSYNETITRILIPTDETQPIYLVDDFTKSVYTAVRSEETMNPLVSMYMTNQDQFTLADAFGFEDEIQFLPREEFQLSSLVYLVEKQPNSFFINELFDDTTELRDDSNEFYTAYSDNISKLQIHKESGILSYLRNSLDQVDNSPYQQIRDSFHALKFIDTWARTTYFNGYNESTSEITYYRYMNGYPILNGAERGLVRMKMSNTRPIEIQYPTEVIQTPLEDREKIVTLPGGYDVVERLIDAGYYSSEIQSMQIGYDWRSSEESSRIAELLPNWYVKMHGTWRTVDAWLSAIEEGDEVGL
ncbi:YycH family regulatory protein [Jeotgalibaca ciconiae]|uniref:Regulatory protein YycH domain-containing protein n=1 Tax=Jeotgalibaca ciconiae TaxID=2496265 RepID=A0A3Q9BJW7_9LACT|nr:two-component system activity regulator YycH [Jeotgalibaca ciconiae]AZP04063.1 hypothetical protein EJN90_04920 [Jeotgalibaca ciconiae]